MHNFSLFLTRAKEVSDWLSKELVGIRGSRAAPAILDGVLVESYGAKMPLVHMANIAVEDARTLRVVPYDAAVLKDVEKAIVSATANLSVSSDEGGVRVSFPELTGESRNALMRVAKGKLEQARVSLRKAREEMLAVLEERERKKEISEDEKFRNKRELEKLVEKENNDLQGSFRRKEKEILG